MSGFKRLLLASVLAPAMLAGGTMAEAAVRLCDGPNGACRVCESPKGPCGPYSAARPPAATRPEAQQRQQTVDPRRQQIEQQRQQQMQMRQQQQQQAQQKRQIELQQRQQLMDQRRQQAEQQKQMRLQQQQQVQQQRQQLIDQRRQQVEQQKQQQMQMRLQQQQQAQQKRQMELQQRQQLIEQQRLQVEQQRLQQEQRRQQQMGGGRPPQPGYGVVGPTPGGQMPPPPQMHRPSGSGNAAAIGIGLGVGAAIGGAYILSNQARGEEEVRHRRETFVDGGVTYVREPGRVIVREQGGPVFIRHDENERFAVLGYRPMVERDGAYVRTYYDRPDGVRIITVTDEDGRLVRRIRRHRDGREVIIIDNSFRPAPRRYVDQVVVMPPPVLSIPRERYIVAAQSADEDTIYETLTAPPVAPVSRRYTLDEVRYSSDLRAQMRSVDVDSITFDSGSWTVDSSQIDRLSVIAAAINKAVAKNPEEVFLIEGHTDAVGDPDDNLSLSDRRAQAVAEALSQNFSVPAENLTTQGYGETVLRVQTDGASRANRRVTVRRITPLIASGEAGATPQQ